MLPRTSLSAQERRLYSSLHSLLQQPGLLRGNLVEANRRCGKEACQCSSDPARRHRALYLGISAKGKRRMVYIPSVWEERVREWVDRYGQLREALEQLSAAFLKRLESRED